MPQTTPNILYQPEKDIRDYSKGELVKALQKMEGHLARAIGERNAARRHREQWKHMHARSVQTLVEDRESVEKALSTQSSRADELHLEARRLRGVIYFGLFLFVAILLVVGGAV